MLRFTEALSEASQNSACILSKRISGQSDSVAMLSVLNFIFSPVSSGQRSSTKIVSCG